MRKIVFVLGMFLFGIPSLWSQMAPEKRVIVYFGQVFSGISYKDSEGRTDNHLNPKIKSTYGVCYQKFLNRLFFVQPNFSYINLGAQSTVNNQKVEWDFHYLGAAMGAGIGRTRKFIHSDFIFKPYGTLSLYGQYAYKADQTIGEQYVNLLKDKEFRNYDVGIVLTGGLNIDFSEYMGLAVEYKYLRSIINLEKNTNQIMRNIGSCVVFGMVIKL